MRKTLNTALSVTIVLSLVSLLSCSSSNEGGNGIITSDGPAVHNVDITNFVFTPQTLSIQTDDKVVWTNLAKDFHRVVWDNGTFISSDNLQIFQTYEIVFTTSGTFPYHCGIHSSMTGSVTVNPAS